MKKSDGGPPAAGNAGIMGVGMAVPSRVLRNEDLESMVDTSDEWIRTRTGIRERRVADENTATSDLAIEACRAALEDADFPASSVDAVVCATCSGDYPWPATACIIQHAIGALRAAAFDLSAACAGFCYALEVGRAMITAGSAEHVLVVGADMLTRFVDWTDRATCVLFGDGAGAVLLGPCGTDEGILASVMGCDGARVHSLYVPAGGTRTPITCDALERRLDKMVMDGREVFRFAVQIMGEACEAALRRAGVSVSDVRLFIPHQANLRISKAAAEHMGLDNERVFNNIDRYGNTSAASVPIALYEAVSAGMVKRGDLIVLVGFGAGLTWAANVIRWSRDEGAPGGVPLQ